MNAYLETAIRNHFVNNSELTVDIVDENDDFTQQTFNNEYDAITDLDNVEGGVFYPFEINDINDLNQ